MRYPVDDFLTKWNITSGFGFGDKTDYGSHEAVDLNLNSGGDSDLGQPLFAIADYEVTSVHSHTTIPSFGLHVHLKIEGSWGVRYAHYAHCGEIFVKVGDKGKESDKIATVGTSGTKAVHCHFAIKKEPTGIDAIAKTLTDLAKWENPMTFIEQYLFDPLSEIKSRADTLVAVATRLNVAVNKDVILSEIDKLIVLEDAIVQKDHQLLDAQKSISELQKKLDGATKQYEELVVVHGETAKLIEEYKKTVDELVIEVKELKKTAETPTLTGWRKLLYDLFIKRR